MNIGRERLKEMTERNREIEIHDLINDCDWGMVSQNLLELEGKRLLTGYV